MVDRESDKNLVQVNVLENAWSAIMWSREGVSIAESMCLPLIG